MYDPVINSKRPWELAGRKWSYPPYQLSMSAAEWKKLLALAESGDAEAEWRVSECYADGCKTPSGRILVRRSSVKALAWLRRSAEHGCDGAQCTLGTLLSDRSKQDVPEAIRWLKRAIRNGAGYSAANNIAVTYRQNDDFRKAVIWFRRAISYRDAGALIQYGIHLYWGIGVRTDHTAAVRCFRRAIRAKTSDICEASRDDGYFYLGIAYLEGKGVRQSIQMAKRQFQRANADNDHPTAAKVLQKLASKEHTRP